MKNLKLELKDIGVSNQNYYIDGHIEYDGKLIGIIGSVMADCNGEVEYTDWDLDDDALDPVLDGIYDEIDNQVKEKFLEWWNQIQVEQVLSEFADKMNQLGIHKVKVSLTDPLQDEFISAMTMINKRYNHFAYSIEHHLFRRSEIPHYSQRFRIEGHSESDTYMRTIEKQEDGKDLHIYSPTKS